MKLKRLLVGVLLLLLLLPVSAVLADGPTVYLDEGRIFVEEDVSLEAGETFNGDLGVFNGDVYVPQGSVVNGDLFVTDGDVEVGGRVNGDLVVLGGDLVLTQGGQVTGNVFGMGGQMEVAGEINGDLAVMFGDLELRDSAVVKGDLMVFSGSMEREPGAQVRGEAMPEIHIPDLPLLPELQQQFDVPPMPDMPEMPEIPPMPDMPPVPVRPQPETFGRQVGNFVGRLVSIGFFSLLFMAVGLLIVFIWPRTTRRVADCIATLPVQSFGLGLLTFLIAAVLESLVMVLMIIIILVAAALISTVILIPIGLLLLLLSVLLLLPVPLALAAGMVLGWVALADLVGQKAIKVLNAGEVKPLGATLIGLLLTVSAAALLMLLTPACCGWPFVILLTSVGLGSVIHTRFGRQDCQQASHSPVPPQAPPQAPAPLPVEAMDEEAGQPDGPTNGTP